MSVYEVLDSDEDTGEKPSSQPSKPDVSEQALSSTENASGHNIPRPSETPDSVQAAQVDDVISRVLEILPDVRLDHLQAVVSAHQERLGHQCAEHVLQMLFEDPFYPKSQKLGKRKRDSEDQDPVTSTKIARVEVDYSNLDRAHTGGDTYYDLALSQLMVDFPLIPKQFLRKALKSHRNFYVPAHLYLETEQKKPDHAYKVKTTKAKVAAKSCLIDPLFLAEREWLEQYLKDRWIKHDAEAAEEIDEQENGGIDCGCCFTAYSFHKMIQCSEGHLFCRDCMVQYAETTLGANKHEIVCMDQSSCKEPFPESELQRFLPEKLLELYNRIKQRKEVIDADLFGLEDCPFCDYKVVIENDQEKLFRCQNEGCMIVSCRVCKKLDHLPKSCKEMEEDKHLDGRHAIEEALSNALMRTCPKCSKSFIKEDGCNKMSCPDCFTLSCYICRQIINGYDHFEQNTKRPSSSKKRCPLWDGAEQINEQIRVAGTLAAEKYRAENPDVAHDIAVEIPVVAAQKRPGGPAAVRLPLPQVVAPVLRLPQNYAFNYVAPLNAPQVQAIPAVPAVFPNGAPYFGAMNNNPAVLPPPPHRPGGFARGRPNNLAAGEGGGEARARQRGGEGSNRVGSRTR